MKTSSIHTHLRLAFGSSNPHKIPRLVQQTRRDPRNLPFTLDLDKAMLHIASSITRFRNDITRIPDITLQVLVFSSAMARELLPLYDDLVVSH
jgi:hypothetical protein